MDSFGLGIESKQKEAQQVVGSLSKKPEVTMNVLLALGLVLGALGFGSHAHAVNVGEQAPCVILNHIAPDGSESEHCIREPEGTAKYKIIEFFSATCSACAENLPKVSALAQSTAGRATTRLVGIDRNEALLRDYVSSHRNYIKFEVALDTERDAKRAYDVVQTPTLFVLDDSNNVVFKRVGVLSSSDIANIQNIVSR